VRQQWQGKVEAVKPMSGFFNIMTPDFHLHLKAGTVASWQDAEDADGWRHALDAKGNRTGLAIGPLA
jgi:putative heme degradation protein